MLTWFAHQLGLAIERWTRLTHLRDLNETLERRVADRTAELDLERLNHLDTPTRT